MQLPISENGALELLRRAVVYDDTELEQALVEQAQRNNWTRVLAAHKFDHPEHETEGQTMTVDWNGNPVEPNLNETNWYDNAEGRARLNAVKGNGQGISEGSTNRALSNAYGLADLDRAESVDQAETERLAAQYDPELDLKYQHEAEAFGDRLTSQQKMNHGYFAPIRAAAQRLGIVADDGAQARKDVDTARAHRDTIAADPKATLGQRNDAEIALHDALAKMPTQ